MSSLWHWVSWASRGSGGRTWSWLVGGRARGSVTCVPVRSAGRVGRGAMECRRDWLGLRAPRQHAPHAAVVPARTVDPAQSPMLGTEGGGVACEARLAAWHSSRVWPHVVQGVHPSHHSGHGHAAQIAHSSPRPPHHTTSTDCMPSTGTQRGRRSLVAGGRGQVHAVRRGGGVGPRHAAIVARAAVHGRLAQIAPVSLFTWS